jgi:hypothetical protein
VQAEQIIAVAERAPYGRGTETLLDTDVRRTWPVGADRVRLSGRLWKQDWAAMVERAVDGLGVGGLVEAELYKLLVYDAGSFFVRHRDSEKAPGMFAALKGSDAAVAGVVVKAARVADWDLYLALVSIAESGWAEYAGGVLGRCRGRIRGR